MVSTRGPIPNRDEDLARPLSRRGGGATDATSGTLLPYKARKPGKWDKPIVELYESMFKSGQRDYYQQSDVEKMWLLCEDLDQCRKAPRRNGQLYTAIWSQMNGLMLDEGTRRRIGIQLGIPAPDADDEREKAIDREIDKLLGLPEQA